MYRIPVYQPTLTEREKALVIECLDSGWISSKGKFVDAFERRFAEYVGAPYGASACNGTVALHLALLALGIGVGDEVILPTLTYIASANAVTYVGASPVLVDSVAGTWQMCPDDVRRAITPRTRAIMLVHLYGHSCDIDALMQIAREHDLLVIEDCAEAIGTRWNGQHVGTFGDVAAFSFYGNKTITTGEGGMLVTANPSLDDRIRHLRGQGLARFREYWHDIIGYNYRMTNVCAAIGCAQLESLELFLERKRQIAERYRGRLGNIVEFQGEVAPSNHSQWMICFLVEKPAVRDRVREYLKTCGIETRPVFYPLHAMPMYSHLYRRLPVAERIGSCGINLPSHPSLTDQEVDDVCQAVQEALVTG